jgi:predicted translin family RNA/ssDNA-binding protein
LSRLQHQKKHKRVIKKISKLRLIFEKYCSGKQKLIQKAIQNFSEVSHPYAFTANERLIIIGSN